MKDKVNVNVPKHRLVVEMNADLMKMLVRLAKAMHLTTYTAVVRQLIVDADKRGKK